MISNLEKQILHERILHVSRLAFAAELACRGSGNEKSAAMEAVHELVSCVTSQLEDLADDFDKGAHEKQQATS